MRHQESPIGSSGETPGITERFRNPYIEIKKFYISTVQHTHTHPASRAGLLRHVSFLTAAWGFNITCHTSRITYYILHATYQVSSRIVSGHVQPTWISRITGRFVGHRSGPGPCRHVLPRGTAYTDGETIFF